jgi:hypothetical protein
VDCVGDGVAMGSSRRASTSQAGFSVKEESLIMLLEGIGYWDKLYPLNLDYILGSSIGVETSSAQMRLVVSHPNRILP